MSPPNSTNGPPKAKAALKYMPLHELEGFCLIKIQPGAATELLRLELVHSTLRKIDPPAFEALSYVWGSPENPTTVEVLSQAHGVCVTSQVAIHRNLATALTHLRHPSTVRTMWADAICINQNDLAERSQQVLMMGDVYRLATRVVVFLGPEENGSGDALKLIEKTGSMVVVDFSSGRVQDSTAGQNYDYLGWADLRRPLPFEAQDLDKIYHLPMSPDLLSLGQTRRLQERLGLADSIVQQAMSGYGICGLRKQVGHAKCSDPRDRLYGLLSQLGEHERANIVPDYTRSVADIYTEITCGQVRRDDRLDVITDCELGEEPSPLALPSWVPDWSTPMESADIHDITPELFHVGPSVAHIDNTRIRAVGARIDRVAAVVHLDRERLNSDSDAETTKYLRALLLSLSESRHVQASNQSQRQRFWESCCRTLWLNNFAEKWVPPVAHQPEYYKCLSMIKMLTSPDNPQGRLPKVPTTSFYLRRCREACASRAFFLTEDGHLGAAFKSVAVGDRVAALFGTFIPMVLRPVSQASGEHRVVSACYLDGRMRGESLLGDLPRSFHGIQNCGGSKELRGAAYMDMETKTIHQDDPRTEPFLQSLQKRGFLTNPSIAELENSEAWDILSRAGLPIETFELV
ncbi:hypothetical protein PspLS_08543 [Pyricularia sp. CBS 133598]|nr:hypothetical protein PspLS_08543 [Pyricularia sp. CBS 133598]